MSWKAGSAIEHSSPGDQITPFPPGFLWGAATAAYQIEGAVAEDGRGPSIWDTFSHTAGKVANRDTGDIAADHYHQWPEDLQHIKNLGLNAYRFSISWSRVQPDGQGAFNATGIAFYRTLIEALVSAGIEPLVTLYHWDLPQALQDQGGWPNRNTAYCFAEYARRMAQELGPLVSIWTTLNEPWCTSHLGYAAGVHAPGITDDAAALAAAHHLNLAHGLAGAAIREVLGEHTQISATLNVHVTLPADPHSDTDWKAARKIDLIGNEIFIGPMLEGRYPTELLDNTARITDWSFVQDGDLDQIRIPLSPLGVNYYFSNRARFYDGQQPKQHADGHGDTQASAWIGCDDVEMIATEGPHTAMGWNIDPGCLTDLLVKLHQRFPDLPLMVTENGAAFDDVVSADGLVHDPRRVDYLDRHFAAARDAIAQGVDLRGYMVWSLLDNFEWAWGYSKRFGIIFIDYTTGERTWKDSAHWYKTFIWQNADQ